MHITADHSLTNSHAAPRSGDGGFVDWLGRTYARWQERQADLRSLQTMTERDLRDARLTRFAVERELARPFWRG
jgi:uncharacterized protein YjiS (DUF1127 family)